MVGEAIRAMPPEGFNILVRLALALLRFNSPSDCNPALVFGISNGCCNLKSPVQPCMDAMPLFIRIEIEGCQSSGNEVVLIEIGFNGSIDDRVDTTIAFKS